VALQLRKLGIRRVRPLLGGFHEWKRLGFPLAGIEQPANAHLADDTVPQHYERPDADGQPVAEGPV
jgi:3-mercaptopyruvate sulfurtransferase SseA